MFTYVRVSGSRYFEYRTGTYSGSTDVSPMLLCSERVRISDGVLTRRNIESLCNKMKGMSEGGLRVVCVGVADQ